MDAEEITILRKTLEWDMIWTEDEPVLRCMKQAMVYVDGALRGVEKGNQDAVDSAISKARYWMQRANEAM